MVVVLVVVLSLLLLSWLLSSSLLLSIGAIVIVGMVIVMVIVHCLLVLSLPAEYGGSGSIMRATWHTLSIFVFCPCHDRTIQIMMTVTTLL